MFRGRRHAGRRLTGEAPAQATPLAAVLSPRRMAAAAMGAAFSLALITLFGSGNPPLPYRRGQEAPEIKARVYFTIVDEERTEALRKNLRLSTPSVYRLDRTLFARELEVLKEAVALVKSAARYEDADAAKAQTLRVTPQFYSAVKAAIADIGDTQLVESAARAFETIARKGSLSASDARLESNRPLDTGISILDGAERRPRAFTDLIKADDLPQALRQELRAETDSQALATQLAAHFTTLKPFLIYDETETNAALRTALDTMKPVNTAYWPGDVMVRKGTLLDHAEIRMLQKEHDEYLHSVPKRDRMLRVTGVAVTVFMLVGLFGAYVSIYEPRVLERQARMLVLMAVALGIVAMTRLLVQSQVPIHLVPVALPAMAVAVAYNPLFGIGYALFLTVLAGISAGSSFSPPMALLLGAVVGVLIIGRVRSRSMPFLAGIAVGGATFVSAWGIGLMTHAESMVTLQDSLYGFLNGVASGVLITVLLPYVERGFNVVTELSLLELVDLNKPVLRRLALEAPGTYNHSLFVGNLSDGAAEMVGANRTLARAGGYYHDIGKLSKPGYFVENIGPGASRHYNLSPTMSALVIISHVKDGAELARQHRLPPAIVDVVREHHGTTLVEYFYREAIEQAGDARQVSDQSFRYPGPRPRTKEAAIVMLADCVESASRTITDPTPGKLENLVLDITRGKLSDGQFDECNVTLAEIKLIELSLVKGLAGIFHSRIKYPGRDL